MAKQARWIEMTGIFLGVPLFLYIELIPHLKIVTLLVLCIVCLVILLRDRTFDRKQFGLNGFSQWRMLAIRYGIVAACLALYTFFAEPQHAMTIVRHNQIRWALIMIIYPILSVVPQEIIYRVFFFHRYGLLFKEKRLSLLANAVLFAVGHIFFRNWVAIIGAFAAGLLWATTYLGSRSLLVVAIEHALYGDLVFTLGIGYYFYNPNF
jgi:membrane protease YdiL (CAAX protease family)